MDPDCERIGSAPAHVLGCGHDSRRCCAAGGSAGQCGLVNEENQCTPRHTVSCANRLSELRSSKPMLEGECQCDEACKTFGDCCADYEEVAAKKRHTRATAAAPVPPPNPCPGGTLTDSCAVGCYSSLRGNGFCDAACNVAACTFDSGDCTAIAPTGWLCSPAKYGDGKCDCGIQCGIVDIDCTGTVDQVYGCPWEGSSQTACCLVQGGQGLCAIPQAGVCSRGNVPAEWFCSLAAWTDDVCDCECGTYDPACTAKTPFNTTGCPTQSDTLGATCCADVSGFGYCSNIDSFGVCAQPVAKLNLAVPAGSLVANVFPVETASSTPAVPERTFSLLLSIAVSGQTLSQYGRQFNVSVVWSNEFGTLLTTVYRSEIGSAATISINIDAVFTGNRVSIAVVVDSEINIVESSRSDNSLLSTATFVPVLETIYPLTNGGVVPIGIGPQVYTYLGLVKPRSANELVTVRIQETHFYFLHDNGTMATNNQPLLCNTTVFNAASYFGREAYPCTFDVTRFINASNNGTEAALNYLIAIAVTATGISSQPVSLSLKPMFIPANIANGASINTTDGGPTTPTSGDELMFDHKRTKALRDAEPKEIAADWGQRALSGAPSTSCSSIPQYFIDFAYNDANWGRYATYEECCNLCASTSGCIAFTFNPTSGGTNCWAKTKMQNYNYVRGSDYELVTGMMAPYNQFSLLPGLVLNGDDIYSFNTNDFAVCLKGCIDRSNCYSLFYSKPDGACYLKGINTNANIYNVGGPITNGLSAVKIGSNVWTQFLSQRVWTQDTPNTFNSKTPFDCKTACNNAGQIFYETWPKTKVCYCKTNLDMSGLSAQSQAFFGFPAYPQKSILPTGSLNYADLLTTGPGRSDLWAKIFQGDGKAYQISTCGMQSSYDSYINVYRSTRDNMYSLELEASNDDSCGQGSSVSFCATSGYVYWVLVSYRGKYLGYGGLTGDFFKVVKGDSCTETTSDTSSACYKFAATGTLSGTCGALYYPVSLGGNTLSSLSSIDSAATCCSRCNDRGDCVAYRFFSKTQYCNLLSDIRTIATVPSYEGGSAVIRGTCAAFQLNTNRCLGGNDITNTGDTTPSGCCTACSGVSNCVGWQLSSGRCYLKSTITSTSSNSGCVSGMKVSGALRLNQGAGAGGTSLASSSVSDVTQCYRNCIGNGACKGFSFSATSIIFTNTCILRLFGSCLLSLPLPAAGGPMCYLYSTTPSGVYGSDSNFYGAPVGDLVPTYATLAATCASDKTPCPIYGVGCGYNTPSISAEQLVAAGNTEAIYADKDPDTWFLKSSCRTIAKPDSGKTPNDRSGAAANFANYVGSLNRDHAICCCPKAVLTNPVEAVADTPLCVSYEQSFDLGGSGDVGSGGPSASKGKMGMSASVSFSVEICTNGGISLEITGSGSQPILGPLTLTVVVKGAASGVLSTSGWSFTSGSATIAGILSITNSGSYSVGTSICCGCCYATINYNAYISAFVNVKMFMDGCSFNSIKDLASGCLFGLKPKEPLYIVVGAAVGASGSINIASLVTVTASADAHIYAGFEARPTAPSFFFKAWELTGKFCIQGSGRRPDPHWHWPTDTAPFTVGQCWGDGLGSNQGWFDNLDGIMFVPPDESIEAQKGLAALPNGDVSAESMAMRQEALRRVGAPAARAPSAPKAKNTRATRPQPIDLFGDLPRQFESAPEQAASTAAPFKNDMPQEFMPRQHASLRDSLAADFTPADPCKGVIQEDFIIRGVYDGDLPHMTSLSGGRLLFCYPISMNETTRLGGAPNAMDYYLATPDSRCSFYSSGAWTAPVSSSINNPYAPAILGDLTTVQSGAYAIGAFVMPAPIPYMKNITDVDVAVEVRESFTLALTTYVPGTGFSAYTGTTKGARLAYVSFAAKSTTKTTELLIGVERGAPTDPNVIFSDDNTNITLWAMPIDPATPGSWASTVPVVISDFGLSLIPSSVVAASTSTRDVVMFAGNDGFLYHTTALSGSSSWTTPVQLSLTSRWVDITARGDDASFVASWFSGNVTHVCVFDGVNLTACGATLTIFPTQEQLTFTDSVLNTDANQVKWTQASPQVVALGDGSTAVVWGESSSSWTNPPMMRWAGLPAGSTSWSAPRGVVTGRPSPIQSLLAPSRVDSTNSFWILESEHSITLSGIPELPMDTNTIAQSSNTTVMTNVYAQRVNALPAVTVDSVFRIPSTGSVGAKISNQGILTTGALTVALYAGDAWGPRAPLGVSQSVVPLVPQAKVDITLNLDSATNQTALSALGTSGYVWVVAFDANSPSCPASLGFIPGHATLTSLKLKGAGDASIKACALFSAAGAVPRTFPLNLTAIANHNGTFPDGKNYTNGQQVLLGKGQLTLSGSSSTGEACVDMSLWVGHLLDFDPPMIMNVDLPLVIFEATSVKQTVLVHPDLVLSVFDVTILKAVTGAMEARVTVHNTGGISACGITVEAFLGSPATGNLLGSLNMPSILGYSDTSAVFQVSSNQLAAGTNASITFYVNRIQTVFEVAMSNNAAQLNVQFVGAAILIVEVTASVSNGVIIITVRNVGDGAALMVPFLLDTSRIPGAPSILPSTIIFPAIAAGTTAYVSIPFTCPGCPTNATFDVSVSVDPAGQVGNLLPGNNKAYNVTAIYAPSITTTTSGGTAASVAAVPSSDSSATLSTPRIIIAVIGSVIAALIATLIIIFFVRRRMKHKKLEEAKSGSGSGSGYGSRYGTGSGSYKKSGYSGTRSGSNPSGYGSAAGSQVGSGSNPNRSGSNVGSGSRPASGSGAKSGAGSGSGARSGSNAGSGSNKGSGSRRASGSGSGAGSKAGSGSRS